MTPPAWPVRRRYQVIYADPPWEYKFSRSRSRQIENQYPTMTTEEIFALPVRAIAALACALYLWTPRPKANVAMRCLEDAWGFDYKTMRIWDKEALGPGYWARDDAEVLLVGALGGMSPPEPSRRPRAMHHEKRNEHSQKPVAIRDQIAFGLPGTKRIELFARDVEAPILEEAVFIPEWREGWDGWGNQIDRRDSP